MFCQNCGKNEVNFRYTQIVNGVKKEMALCDKCAKNWDCIMIWILICQLVCLVF